MVEKDGLLPGLTKQRSFITICIFLSTFYRLSVISKLSHVLQCFFVNRLLKVVSIYLCKVLLVVFD